MPKQDPMDRTSGFLKKNLETLPHKKRLEYLNQKLRGIIQYAYKNSVAFKNKMDSVGLKLKDIQTIKDLEKIPITNKADLVELQKKNPPFGGLEGVPVNGTLIRKYYTRTNPWKFLHLIPLARKMWAGKRVELFPRRIRAHASLSRIIQKAQENDMRHVQEAPDYALGYVGYRGLGDLKLEQRQGE